jgi:O-antigen/teichoic acid export membrane protein
MSFVRRFLRGGYGTIVGNVAARFGALVSLSAATFLVARSGGPAAVGVYALLRMLPSLVGVTLSCGLPGATAYFLAGPERGNRRLPLTLLAIALAGGCAGAALWAATSPLLQDYLFQDLSTALVLVASLLVLTRVLVATAKSCSQGSDDLRGANRVIVTEELMFLPVYGALWATGGRGFGMIVSGLLIADVLTASLAWGRLARRSFFTAAQRPSAALGRRIGGYGMRAQVGSFVMLLNLRLDFLLVSVITGPTVLGVYAIASRYAELVRVLTLAVTYVLYPRFAADFARKAVQTARSLIPTVGLVTGAAIVPLWLAAPFVIPLIYGEAFRPAISPAQIILFGFVLHGVAAVITALLYGLDRPGLNSIAMGIGLGATVVLDVVLIPQFGAVGAATASAVAYLATTAALIWFFLRIRRAEQFTALDQPGLSNVS